MLDIPITGTIQDIIDGVFGALIQAALLLFSLFFGGIFGLPTTADEDHNHGHHF